MEDNLIGGVRGDGRMPNFVARVEAFYLSALRITLLLLATILVFWAMWYGVSGAYKVSRNAASVKVEPATVTAAEVVDIPSQPDADASGKPADPVKAERAYYKQFVDDYYGLFAKKYQPYRQADDGLIDRAAFDQRFVKSNDRLAAVSRGELDFGQDKADLDDLLKNMREVTELPASLNRLTRYRSAKKVSVKRTIRGSNSERYCSYYGYYIGECIIWSTRQVPYARTVSEARLPKGLMAPVDLLHTYQDRHFDLLTKRRHDNFEKAEDERNQIAIGNISGAQRLWQGVLLVGGFLGVMFLFLLIAIERHQRKLAAAVSDVERAGFASGTPENG